MNYRSESEYTDITRENDIVIYLDNNEFYDVTLPFFRVNQQETACNNSKAPDEMTEDSVKIENSEIKANNNTMPTFDELGKLSLNLNECIKASLCIASACEYSEEQNLGFNEISNLRTSFSIIQSNEICTDGDNLPKTDSVDPILLDTKELSLSKKTDSVDHILLNTKDEPSVETDNCYNRPDNIYFITSTEAHESLDNLLTNEMEENVNPFLPGNQIRTDDFIASSEEEFISDSENELSDNTWIRLVPELRKSVLNILKKLNPHEPEYKNIVDDILYKYLRFVINKRRMATKKRIIEIVCLTIPQLEKTNLLIQSEIVDKKLNIGNNWPSTEPSHVLKMCEKRKQAIHRKYFRCHNDPIFCENYFKQSVEQTNRPLSKLSEKIAKLKKKINLVD